MKILQFLMIGSPFWAVLAADPHQIKQVDRALFRDRDIVLIRYVPWSAQVWTPADLKKWVADEKITPAWKPLVKPNRDFIPINVFPGQFHNYLVLELGEKALWQLDSNFQVLSRLKLPEELADSDLQGLQIFWTVQQRILFVNTSKGQVTQTIERSGKLEILRRDKIPLQCRECYPTSWKKAFPKKSAYICLSEKKLWFFDAFFGNPQAVDRTSPMVDSLPLFGPMLLVEKEGPVLLRKMDSLPFCFLPQLSEFTYCPDYLK